jgi:hypothetical protein
MWTTNFSQIAGWSIKGFCVAHITREVTYYSTSIDPIDFFWIAVADVYTNIDGDCDNSITIREIIKRKIPFRIQYSVEEYENNTMEEKWYNTFINYTIVVDDPKYALMCKLTWG